MKVSARPYVTLAGAVSLMALTSSFVIPALVANPTPASAAPPANSPCIDNPALPDCVWWSAQTNVQTGQPCCGPPGQDGHVLEPLEPGATPTENSLRYEPDRVGKPTGDTAAGGDTDYMNPPDGPASGWQVFVGGRWWDVPQLRVTKIAGLEPDENLRSKPKAWYAIYNDGSHVVGVHFYCFEQFSGF